MNPAELDGHVGFYPDPPDNLPEHLDSLEDGPPGCKPYVAQDYHSRLDS